MDKLKINFYNIDACGYYVKQKLKFGNLLEILLDFKDWVNNKNLNETCTFSTNDDNGDILPVYCFDIVFSNDKRDAILTTWNETETIRSGMASVNGLDPIGNPKVETTSVPAGHIPGYPTYFWFSISHGTLATIRLDNSRLNGHKGLKLLFNSFLSKFSKYVVVDSAIDESPKDESINAKVLGYQENEEKGICSKVSPVFRTSVKRIEGELEFIRRNCNKITKILRKDCLHTMESDDIGFLLKLLSNMGLKRKTIVSNETRIKYELPINNLEEQELNDIIKNWSEDKEKWSDVGFKIDGEPEPKWLSHSIVKEEIEINADKTEKGILKAESLLNEIIDHKEKLIPLIERQN